MTDDVEEQITQPRIFQRPIFWLKLAELIIGKVCLILTAIYGKVIILCLPLDVTSEGCGIRHNLYIVASIAYSMIIQNVIMLNYIRYRQAYERTFVDPLFSMIGFIVYVTSGGIQLYYGIYFGRNTQSAISALFLITGVLYLADFLHCIVTKWRDKSFFFQKK